MKLAATLSIIVVICVLIGWFVLHPKAHVIPTPAIQVPVSHNLTTTKSNKWYSSIYKGLPTNPIFSLPLAVKFTPDGLGFSYPKIDAQPDTVFASYTPDFSVGTTMPFSDIKIDQVGDWHVKATASNSTESMSAIIAHGVPYIHLSSPTGVWNIKAADTFVVTNKTTKSLLLSAHGNNYVVVWKNQGETTVTDTTITIKSSPQLFVALLDSLDHQQLFIDQSESPILGTLVQWHVLPTTIETEYIFNTPKPALFTLYPHQKASLVGNKQILGEYHSIRGPLSLIQSDSFKTSIPKITPADSFAPLKTSQAKVKNTLIADTANVLQNAPTESKNYGQSVWMGKLANLIELAQTVDAPEQKQLLIASATAALVDAKNWYEYDATQYSYISKKPEFGNERLNDHHFHYGYPIRLAAIVAKYNPSAKSEISDTVNEFVADIATNDRGSDTYPFLRNFDIYEGHSWADGFAAADDGNNHESSSEAINAWYGVYLWANVSGDSDLANTALYLYNSEIQSTKYYWFNIGDIYPSPYAHKIASLIWGGKVDYNTWFGNLANYKYGIELLPLTPASEYLKTIPNYFEYEADFLRSGGSYSQPWGELMLVWKSYTSRDVSVDQLPNQSEISPLSVLQYLIYSHTNN